MPDDAPVTSQADIPGWFRWLDRRIFAALLDHPSDPAPGVVVELGAYLGKSAVVIGDHLRPGDRFVVMDLFGSDEPLGESAQDEANRQENQRSYRTLTRQKFEQNYLALHPELPEVFQGLSSGIVDHVEPGSARFVHVDASHLYAHVRVDVANTKILLRPGGIAVFDDFRSLHTPGVAAAVWEAVFTAGLIPFAVTPNKLYAVYDDPVPYLAVLRELFTGDNRFPSEEQDVAGHTILRLNQRDTTPAATPVVAAAAAPPAGAPPATPATPAAPPLTGPGRTLDDIVRDISPPALTRYLSARRRRRTG